jgi:imidazolonepropionase-like amidohydrolase
MNSDDKLKGRPIVIRSYLQSLLCIALFPALAAAQQAAPAAAVTAIRAGRITAVGADVRIPAGAEVLDLSNMTVLPGLVDCHTHVADLTDPEPLHYLRYTAAEIAYATIPNARATRLRKASSSVRACTSPART